ncbi:MAG: tetratricopeptide repeat protein [Oscillatoriales cyanobacterium C42_A2020_001]|nr:tetratricopeptide repeat protein [Leptolyngbyaceae cyanobacterium C42_A2020_001]
MKNRSWLNLAENVMLAGAGVGSIATAASQQFIFAAAPLSALAVLNLLKHRQIEQTAQQTTETAVSQLDQKYTHTLNALQQQIQALPSPLHLANLRKDLQTRNQTAFHELSQQLQTLQSEAAKPEWRAVSQDVAQLKELYVALGNSVAGVRESLSRLGNFTKVDTLETELAHCKTELAQLQTNLQALAGDQKFNNYRVLQDQINHLNRRLNKLPAPFDAGALRQDVESLIKVIAEMASRRDVARLEAQLEKLVQQSDVVEQSVAPIKVVTNILRKQVDTVTTRMTVFEQMLAPNRAIAPAFNPEVVYTLEATVNTLEQRINQLPNSLDLASLRSEVQGLVANHLGQLQQQLETVQQQTQDLDQQHRTLRDWVHRLPQLLDSSALQNEVKYLATRVEWAENHLVDLQTRVGTAPTHDLVVDLKEGRQETGSGSRAALEQALRDADARLIVVFPFPSPAVLDDDMIQQFRQFLDRKGCLDVGWGHLGRSSDGLARSIDQRRTISPTENEFLFNRLNQLTELKKQYPDQFRFKVLGTDEYFLVCDRAYAVLGAESLTTTSMLFPKATVGLRTVDANLIQTLVERFDHPVLDSNDAAAYFNRAVTRYELGDRPGALADYTAVLAIRPDDAVALNNRGLVHYDLGDKEAAIADFAAALQHNPQNFIVYANRGYVRSELGDKAGAIADYTAALQLNPDYATAYFYRGLARTRLQNKPGAIQDYTEVIRLHPEDASAYFYRGLANAKVGQSMDALRDLRQAAQLFATQGDSANYQQAVNAIKKLHKTMVGQEAGKPLVSNGA